jgi:UDP-2,3-diacylglucosamine pyrophosphatase LpxH
MDDKKELDVVIISDVHLGTYGCHAKELLLYLKSIQPKKLILNGDIIDVWNFSKTYFPASHMDVIRRIMKMASKGTEVIYITGNHDDLLRKYTDLQFGNIQLVDKYLLEFDNKKAWIFHGDVFDASTTGMARTIAKLGGKGYDYLILFNRFINWILELFGKQKMSLSKKVKERVKKAVAWINNFELTAAELGIEQQYDYVICGHIHQAQHRTITNNKGSIVYLNSGDWIENLTALEYHNHQWNIYEFNPKHYSNKKHIPEPEEADELDLLSKIRYA